LNRALVSLETESTYLEKIPTWPWEPCFAQRLIFSMLFPLATWLLEQLLWRFLGTNCF
jgi:hypothetical protein